ncbi:MAG: hypothetical protein JSR18_05235 [Proteobacteria bacterium]|nr:hypothetical protein [Pseudomonadota bacterium]
MPTSPVPGLEYFSGVAVLHEVLQAQGVSDLDEDEQIALLIDYIENDALPAWFTDRVD